jgi:septum formation protein
MIRTFFPLILASASPRRRELMQQAGFSLRIEKPDVPEVRRRGEKPTAFARRLAAEKAAVIGRRHPESVILAADTIVVLGRRVLGKPRDAAEARRMLRALSGQTHRVITAFALLAPSRCLLRSVSTQVTFRSLSRGEIDAYVASGDPMDKAGAYAIQGGAAGMVRSIRGSYTNVVGLPVAEVLQALHELTTQPAVARKTSS